MGDVAIVAAGGVLLTVPANWLVRRVLSWSRGPAREYGGAGRWIGALERLLIYVLALMGQAGAAGLVVAAKSILRFPELSHEPRRIDPEYVLVGSLTSWLLAFAIGAGVSVLIG